MASADRLAEAVRYVCASASICMPSDQVRVPSVEYGPLNATNAKRPLESPLLHFLLALTCPRTSQNVQKPSKSGLWFFMAMPVVYLRHIAYKQYAASNCPTSQCTERCIRRLIK